MKLVLFDIDGVLIKSPSVHTDAFLHAVNKVCGLNLQSIVFNYGGLTDRIIIRKILENNNIQDEAKIKEATEQITKSFLELVKEKPLELLGGVLDLLEELDKNKEITIGVISGGSEGICEQKLKLLDIGKYFKVKFFGGDNFEKEFTREDILKKAIKQAEKLFNFKFNNNAYYFGDSITDVKAAKNMNMVSMAVSTGHSTKEELEKENPEFLFENLKNTEKIMKAIFQ